MNYAQNLGYINQENSDSKTKIPLKNHNINPGAIFSEYRRGIHTDMVIKSHLLRVKFCQTCI